MLKIFYLNYSRCSLIHEQTRDHKNKLFNYQDLVTSIDCNSRLNICFSSSLSIFLSRRIIMYKNAFTNQILILKRSDGRVERKSNKLF